MWLFEAYFAFSAFIAVTAAASTLSAFWDVRKNLLDIQRLSRFTTSVRVLRHDAGDALITVDSSELVPGDVLVIDQVSLRKGDSQLAKVSLVICCYCCKTYNLFILSTSCYFKLFSG